MIAWKANGETVLKLLIAESKEGRVVMKFAKYLAISGTALLLDLFTYNQLTIYQTLSPQANAAVSYTAGLLYSYLIFVCTVFSRGRHSSNRKIELSMFLASGLLGVVVSYIVAGIVSNLIQQGPWVSKISAVLVSFTCVYLFRVKLVF